MSTIVFFFIIMILVLICMIGGCVYYYDPMFITGIIIMVAGFAFLAIAENYCTFVSVQEEYSVCESTLSLSGKYGNPVYVVTYQKEDGTFEIGKTSHVLHKESLGADVFALCEYKFWFLKLS